MIIKYDYCLTGEVPKYTKIHALSVGNSLISIHPKQTSQWKSNRVGRKMDRGIGNYWDLTAVRRNNWARTLTRRYCQSLFSVRTPKIVRNVHFRCDSFRLETDLIRSRNIELETSRCRCRNNDVPTRWLFRYLDNNNISDYIASRRIDDDRDLPPRRK